MIGELSDYSDYGIQEYGTTGWDADPNYTGQPTNATHTTHQFHARALDPQTGTWTTQDTWRGLLTQPQTLNRYGYVTNNPTTLTDYMGYRPLDDTDDSSPFNYWVPEVPSISAINLLRPPPPTPPFYLQRPAAAPGRSYLPIQAPTALANVPGARAALGGTGAKIPTVFSPSGASQLQLTQRHVGIWDDPSVDIGGIGGFPTMQDTARLPAVTVPQVVNFTWVGIFPVIQLNVAETATATSLAAAYKQCTVRLGGSRLSLIACATTSLQISIQATIATGRGECVQLAPAPIGMMAFRYTGGFCS